MLLLSIYTFTQFSQWEQFELPKWKSGPCAQNLVKTKTLPLVLSDFSGVVLGFFCFSASLRNLIYIHSILDYICHLIKMLFDLLLFLLCFTYKTVIKADDKTTPLCKVKNT